MFVRKFSRQLFPAFLAVTLLLTGCNIGAAPAAPTVDINAMNTAIVGTTVAQLSGQLTQTALAAPATATSIPTDTPASAAAVELSTAVDATSEVVTGETAFPTFSLDAPSPTALAGFTQLVVPPTVAPAATAALGDACSNSAFEGDITVPDGTILGPGENFQKVWKLRNTGNCTWDDGFALVYIGGTEVDLDPYDFQFKKNGDFVAPGEAINIGINLTTPCKPGKYNGTWRMRNDKGYYFGTPLSVYVEVTSTKGC